MGYRVTMQQRKGSSLIVMIMGIMLIFCMISWSKSAASSRMEKLSAFRILPLHEWVRGSRNSLHPKVAEAYDIWHKCISDILLPVLDNPKQLWSSFRGAVNTCYSNTPMKKINLTGVRNKDEFKVHIFNITEESPSTIITLGVGGDVLAEQRLKERLPNETLFYGADPIYEENGRLYSTVGQFFPVAVGNETKLTRAYVMPNLSNGKYEFRTMLHLDVITFLKDLTQTHFIDQLLMDNEGEALSPSSEPGKIKAICDLSSQAPYHPTESIQTIGKLKQQHIALSERSVRAWFQRFKAGNKKLEDEPRSGRPTAMSFDELKNLAEQHPNEGMRYPAASIRCSLSSARSHRFDTIITADEKWVLYVNHTNKRAWCAGDEMPDPFVKGEIH
ncbi:hypothetical protein RB195_019627 [Necator americanus]|uniref:Uncharacterized protein n=1 Tax=Necator americanus TaxID=51031 RepID=A0ABR1CGQ2_NECAM